MTVGFRIPLSSGIWKRIMKIKKLYLFVIFFTALHFCSYTSHAQFIEVPIPHKKPSEPNFRNQGINQTASPVTIPFFEDFSGYTGLPDTSNWLNSQHVLVNAGLGLNPPTINVATLDGVRNNGMPHNSDPAVTGPGDSLVSQPILLHTLSEAQRNTTYLSFFWQLKGNGEAPDFESGDSLRLQFKSSEGQWTTVWKRPDQDFTGIEVDTFYQDIVRITEAYFHEGFQFRFQSFGKLSGPYDNWNLDYIYLNSGRSSSDLSYFDRALTTRPSPIFNGLTAVPQSQFLNQPENFAGSTSVDFYNLDASGRFQGVTYTVQLFNAADNSLITTLNQGTATTPSPTRGMERIILQSAPLNPSVLADYINNPENLADTLEIKTVFSILSGETFLINQEETVPGDTVFYPKVDLRINDTTEAIFTLGDFMAYDDGTAEFGGRIAARAGQLAYQFTILEPDTISHIDIYFPTISGNPSGRSIDLMVWKDLDNSEARVLRRQPIIIQSSDSLNQFNRYTFDSPVRVEGTFYVGWRQTTNDELNVGLDKNTEKGEKIYFNTRGIWEQNTQVNGSLMMRPVFQDVPITVGIHEPEIEAASVQVYPNPGQGRYFIRGKADEIKVFDVLGKEVDFSLHSKENKLYSLEIINKVKGIYIIHINEGDRIYKTKIILN